MNLDNRIIGTSHFIRSHLCEALYDDFAKVQREFGRLKDKIYLGIVIDY